MTMDNTNGCDACDCDPGGSTSFVCDVTTGACSCRANIEGRRCNETTSTNYGPVLSQLTFDAEFADDIAVSITCLSYGYISLFL